MTKKDSKQILIGGVIFSICAAVFYICFVYLYPRIFPSIERSHPENYSENIAHAIEQGDMQAALKIARQATKVEALDPGSFTLYGQLLKQSGRKEDAGKEFEKAVAITQTPGPDYKITGRPYYGAEPRLELGTLAMEDGNQMAALTHFELARPYAQLHEPEYNKYHKTLFKAYADTNQWARALDFYTPSNNILNTFDNDSLIKLGYACEALQRWELMKSVSTLIKGQDADYFSGRFHLEIDNFDEARKSLELVDLTQHPSAAFYLGLACEKAGDIKSAKEAYEKTPETSLFRPFAILSLQGDTDEIDRYFENSMPMDFSKRTKGHSRFRLLGADRGESCMNSGAFPVMLLWEDNQTENDSMQIHYGDGGSISLVRGRFILQLQWARNLLMFSGLNDLPESTTDIPGWRKTTHFWEGLENEASAQIMGLDGNPFLNITNTNAAANAVLITNRTKLKPCSDYLIAARAKGQEAQPTLTWVAIDDREWEVMSRNWKLEHDTDWRWICDYAHAPIFWDTMTVRIGMYKFAGSVAFDDIMLLEIKKPV